MKHLFLVNPAAGKKGSTEVLVQHIQARFGLLDYDYEICLTEEIGDAERITREIGKLGHPARIYACGGDGTLNAVVNGAAGYDNLAVTNVPKGTGNDFIRIFGADSRKGFCDLEALAVGPQTPFDLIDCNGRLGIDVVCAGIDARVGNDVHKYKTMPLVRGSGAYLMSLADNVLFKGVSQHATLEAGAIELDEEITLICVCNGRYYGGGFMPVPEALPDDGVLDMLVIPKVSKLTLATVVGDYSKGKYKKHPKHILSHKGDHIAFSFQEESVVVIDGEPLFGKDFTVQLSEKKVNFFYPAYLSYTEISGT